MKKFLLSVTTLLTLGLGSATAFADTPPWPECVNNPACNSNGGCTVSSAPGAAVTGAGAVAGLAAAAALYARRRRAR